MSTHSVTVSNGVVRKIYKSSSRGEPEREWIALDHIQAHYPDLAPRPISADLNAEPPSITMSELPGRSLPALPSDAELAALAIALGRLWSLPIDPRLARWPHTTGLNLGARLLGPCRPGTGLQDSAIRAARRWWRSGDQTLLANVSRPVVGQQDPNLANYLWDGQVVRIVDFEDAAISDPSHEVALLAEHLSTRDLDSDHLCARFDVDSRRLTIARRVLAMYWLWRLLPGGPSADFNPAEAADNQARRLLALLDS